VFYAIKINNAFTLFLIFLIYLEHTHKLSSI
jgi:hypothetical protein